jgi:enhancing lycopene biosynthesis protein 2
MKKIAVILSGCGVYDGSEIHEAVLTLLEIKKQGADYFCFAPDKDQLHVINHTNGEEMSESRNILVESARIARGEIKPLSQLNVSDFDGLMLPGGFGAAKNLTTWALSGPKGDIDPEVKRVLSESVTSATPVALICMSPVIMAKALEGTDVSALLTVGNTEDPSLYEIGAISGGMESLGARARMCGLTETIVDREHKIVTSPAYMMDVDISQVAEGIANTVKELLTL